MPARKEPTASDVATIEKRASEGCSLLEIAREIGIAKVTLVRWRESHESVAEALEFGKAREHTALRSKLMEKALAGDTVALLFLLKTRHGYREQGEASDAGNRVSITFQLPGAMPLKSYVIEEGNAADDRTERLPTPASDRS